MIFEKEPRQFVAELLIQLRRSVLHNFPIGNSSIAFDMALVLFSNFARGREPMNIKALFGNLPYSDMGMRYHLNALIRDGWVVIDKSVKDSRNRRVRPTEKLLGRFDSVVHEMRQLLGTESLKPLI
ncbi:MAG: MarR family transcriptional regulator [Burkholderiaceae bacterium]|nr:MarR family transcriptional regulator [Burkholderiaceae bacterium]